MLPLLQGCGIIVVPQANDVVISQRQKEAWLYSLETGKLLKQFHRDGKVDGELFHVRVASPDKIVSWGTRPNSNRVRLRV